MHYERQSPNTRCIASDVTAAVVFISSAVQHLSFGVRPAAILTHGDQTAAVKMELENRLRMDSSAMHESRCAMEFESCDGYVIVIHARIKRNLMIICRMTT